MCWLQAQEQDKHTGPAYCGGNWRLECRLLQSARAAHPWNTGRTGAGSPGSSCYVWVHTDWGSKITSLNDSGGKSQHKKKSGERGRKEISLKDQTEECSQDRSSSPLLLLRAWAKAKLLPGAWGQNLWASRVTWNSRAAERRWMTSAIGKQGHCIPGCWDQAWKRKNKECPLSSLSLRHNIFSVHFHSLLASSYLLSSCAR